MIFEKVKKRLEDIKEQEKLLDELEEQKELFEIDYLFHKETDAKQEQRKKRWQKALARLYRDSAMLDYLYYQIATDKERIFRGKSSREMTKGARQRTLFLIYQAKMSYLEEQQKKTQTADEKKVLNKEKIKTQNNYNKLIT